MAQIILADALENGKAVHFVVVVEQDPAVVQENEKDLQDKVEKVQITEKQDIYVYVEMSKNLGVNLLYEKNFKSLLSNSTKQSSIQSIFMREWKWNKSLSKRLKTSTWEFRIQTV